jgi:hypothetical protein
MDEELESIRKNKTYTVTTIPAGRKAIDTKWIFKVKKDSDGNIARLKARLVAKGYRQQQGIDYDETFAPVTKFTTLRTLLALAALHNLELDQMDVTTAFLNGDLQEEIYVNPPAGIDKQGEPHQVWRLHKALYGLKQAPRAWYEKIHAFLTTRGFIRTDADHSLYVLSESDGMVIIAIYVDDFTMAATSRTKLNTIKDSLSSHFAMKDMGALHYILGMQVTRDRQLGTITLGQPRYTNNILQRFGLADSKPVTTPMDAHSPLLGPDGKMSDSTNAPYAEAVGSLMYAMVGTRPDIAFPVSMASRYLQHRRMKTGRQQSEFFATFEAPPTSS